MTPTDTERDREAALFQRALLARLKLFLKEMEGHFQEGDSDSAHLQTIRTLLNYM